jgi:enamine deaminase RidA (YjgF/YER057c/UK114 family)
MTTTVDQNGMRLSITNAGAGELFISVSAAPKTAAAISAHAVYEAVANLLALGGAVPVHERIFGSLSFQDTIVRARQNAFSTAGIDTGTPVTYIEGHPPWGEGLSGVIIQAISVDATKLVTAMDGHTPVGRRWTTAAAEYLMLQNIDGCAATGGLAASSVSNEMQASRLFDKMGRIIADQGFSCTDMVRTWFYLRDILTWYDDFNRARNAAYQRFGLMPSAGKPLILPSSTGIGGRTPHGSAVTADILAVKHRAMPPAQILSNPGQKEAFQYGSAFSRASLIKEAGADIVHVSGTAAIDEAGQSLYPEDDASQISCTLDKLTLLLEGAGATLGQTATANVFVKTAESADRFWKIAEARGLGDFPGVVVVADICRGDLLFEIDAEIVLSKKEPHQ